ncbi:nuclear GTPase SLIP-GC [Colletotrichum liriopes]|uniref:Nuclear GTPase SLIP-GC n=1 Tax=Colletotrichum liriopes TaxID=708192 RepID=A0AA37GUR3_9PEZI|nr:nuclear GTPase SLIP-GC [Colletotrichum liriopes]
MENVQDTSSVSLLALQKLELAKNDTDATKLRDVNAKTTNLLGDIQVALANISGLKRAQTWRESIDKLRGEYRMPRFVIGVLGDTGSGKSSLINAVLDEERVVPTNCMRACTAVITEISWNSSEDPTKKYRAEIEFITQAEWTTEVIDLHRDILDLNGNLSSDIRNADSDAGIAYAVLKAVYPKHTDRQLRDTDPAVLANFAKVREVIGKTQVVEEAKCGSFYSIIQSFVDSEEKRSKNGTDTANTASQEQTMAFWPLIKVVRLYLKSEVVSTGVVLVDLPGGRDSNATRAAVAAKYVKECSRLWVVAPITRAVDDKTAKTLLGDHFKQQLKYDGAYNNITFICTKADDISLDEAAPSLGIDEFIANEQERKTQTETQIEEKKQALAALELQKPSILERYGNATRDVDTWQGLRKQVAKGERAFAPMASPQKRKRSQLQTVKEPATTKKVKKDVASSDTDDTSDESDPDDGNDSDEEGQREPLTLEGTRKKLDELKAAKKAVKQEKRDLFKRVSHLKDEVKSLNKQRAAVKVNMYRECIQGRNTYSRDAIKQDFAFGLKEFDEELLAEQQQDDAQQAQGEAPDYEQIGKDLPVFCISSRGYQQLRNRMKKDHRVVGFTSLSDTEVPGLRNHTLELAASIQASHFRYHLSEICRLLGALDLFVAGDIANLKLSDKDKKQETVNLEKALSKLGKTLGEVVTRCMTECNEDVRKNVLKKTGRGASKASEKALSTAEGWGAKYDAGGLRYMTYKATCRRLGVFKGSAGPRDFNEGKRIHSSDNEPNIANTHIDLLKPLKNHIAHDWAFTFRHRLPEKLANLAVSMKQEIDTFHDRMKDRRFLVENNDIVNVILVKLLAAQKESLVHIGNEQQKLVQKAGKEANRLFGPVIQRAMLRAYNDCVEQHGKRSETPVYQNRTQLTRGVGNGSFIIMKGIMNMHVESIKNSMFRDAARDVEEAIIGMLRSLEMTVRTDANGVINAMQEDYIGLIGEVATEADNRARKALGPVLREFYKKLDVALTPAAKEEADPEAVDVEIMGEASDDEYRPDADESD